jgi:hypothetical protein
MGGHRLCVFLSTIQATSVKLLSSFDYGISASFVRCVDNSPGWALPRERKVGYEPRVSCS